MREHEGHDRAARDATTVETGHAPCGAACAAAVVLGAVGGPALLLGLAHLLPALPLPRGAVLAAALFAGRVAAVPVRRRGPAQPSQPGRTSPDS